jgi:hypothetical protein
MLPAQHADAGGQGAHLAGAVDEAEPCPSPLKGMTDRMCQETDQRQKPFATRPVDGVGGAGGKKVEGRLSEIVGAALSSAVMPAARSRRQPGQSGAYDGASLATSSQVEQNPPLWGQMPLHPALAYS